MVNFRQVTLMIEINPILAQIADLRGRVESLRGYL
jgi:peptide chain release factor 2